jgi:deoxyhypusine monooxygenase
MNSDPTIQALRATLIDENAALAKRFRALFSLKHVAAQQPATAQTVPAIEAIASAFTSPSALLKHELAYCLGQTGKDEAVPFLRKVIENRGEDAMCRHEAAEALGALGDMSSIELLKQRRDDTREEEVVRETCDIAVERIEWEHSQARQIEKLKQRYDQYWSGLLFDGTDVNTAILHLSIQLLHLQHQHLNLPSLTSNNLSSTPLSHSSSDTERCSPFEI